MAESEILTHSKASPAEPVRASPEREAAKGWDFLLRLKRRLTSIAASRMRFLDRLIELFKIRPPDTSQTIQRIQRMERDVVLPIKAAAAGLLIYRFYFTHWVVNAANIFEVPLEYAHSFLWFWVCATLAMGWLLFNIGRLRPPVVETAVFLDTLVDGIFLGVLTLVTGGYNSILYWLFLALIARTAVSVPRPTSQFVLNTTLCTCYVLAGYFDNRIADWLEKSELASLDMYNAPNPAEPLLLRLVLLLLMTFGCYAIQVLLERQRQVEEEAREFAVREVQLRSAGRLAAEFAHQIKNPLAIINNAAFSLLKAIKESKVASAEQIGMIQEEVERADRIITQVMGYAQLSEGHVEKLDVIEELDRAIERVFPAAADYPIRVRKDYTPPFPPLLMLRRHASETFMNVLQNAREALEGKNGNVLIKAESIGDQFIQVMISDDGPGIPPAKQGRIFEAYYTTKERGTGLGLATVKHNVELYGGTVRVESELGKGARFTLVFPAKTFVKQGRSS